MSRARRPHAMSMPPPPPPPPLALRSLEWALSFVKALSQSVRSAVVYMRNLPTYPVATPSHSTTKLSLHPSRQWFALGRVPAARKPGSSRPPTHDDQSTPLAFPASSPLATQSKPRVGSQRKHRHVATCWRIDQPSCNFSWSALLPIVLRAFVMTLHARQLNQFMLTSYNPFFY